MMLPFTYTCDASFSVYEQTKQYFEGQPDVYRRLSKLAWAYFSVGKVIPTTSENIWSGHSFPKLDSWEEIQVSYNLCLLGFYKQAMASLRSSFELGLLSVYWNLDNDGHEVIQNWLCSREDTPRFGEVWRKLERHPNFRIYQQHDDIKQRLLDLGYLHNYVHAKGHKFSNSIGLLKSNHQTFEESGFNKWFTTYEEVVKILCILHLIKYPIGVIRFDYSTKFGLDVPAFGGLDEFEVDRLEEVIGQDALKTIQLIAESDSNVQELLKWINNLPDISEEEIQIQLIQQGQILIEGIGFNAWFNMMQQDVNQLSDYERNLYTQRVEFLYQWAKENGYENSFREQPSCNLDLD